jgi:hypothetical protein
MLANQVGIGYHQSRNVNDYSYSLGEVMEVNMGHVKWCALTILALMLVFLTMPVCGVVGSPKIGPFVMVVPPG